MRSYPPILAVVVVSTLLDAAAALAVLFWRRAEDVEIGPTPIGLRRVGRASAVVAAAFLVKLPIWATIGVARFGWVSLAYADLVVLTPAVGALVLASPWWRPDGRPRWRPSRPVRLVALASLLLVPVGIDATWIEPFRLQLERARVDVSPDREGRRAVRIGVLTDLQTNRVTDYERGAVDRLMAQRPDVILLPGDIFQGTPEQFEATRDDLGALLGRLSAPGGVYLVGGDTDHSAGHLLPLLRPVGIQLLDDQVVHVAIGDRRLTIGGVRLDFQGPGARKVVHTLERGDDPGDVRILLAHRPDAALGLAPGSRIDLVVAGHTHGGQIVVPGFGPPVTLSDVPRAVAAGGLHAIAGNPIYVSRGVGCERGQAPRVRFLCPPEISLLEIVTHPSP